MADRRWYIRSKKTDMYVAASHARYLSPGDRLSFHKASDGAKLFSREEASRFIQSVDRYIGNTTAQDLYVSQL